MVYMDVDRIIFFNTQYLSTIQSDSTIKTKIVQLNQNTDTV